MLIATKIIESYLRVVENARSSSILPKIVTNRQKDKQLFGWRKKTNVFNKNKDINRNVYDCDCVLQSSLV